MNKLVWISRAILAKIQFETFAWYPLETGGLLAGYVDLKGNIVISDATKSGPNAIHNYYNYTPDYKYDREKIARIYRKSNGVSVYLGDWHTHPKSASYMSDRDTETLIAIAASETARMPAPIMVVLGTMPYQVKGWQLRKGRITEVTISIY